MEIETRLKNAESWFSQNPKHDLKEWNRYFDVFRDLVKQKHGEQLKLGGEA